jgi:hypothetical protein
MADGQRNWGLLTTEARLAVMLQSIELLDTACEEMKRLIRGESEHVGTMDHEPRIFKLAEQIIQAFVPARGLPAPRGQFVEPRPQEDAEIPHSEGDGEEIGTLEEGDDGDSFVYDCDDDRQFEMSQSEISEDEGAERGEEEEGQEEEEEGGGGDEEGEGDGVVVEDEDAGPYRPVILFEQRKHRYSYEKASKDKRLKPELYSVCEAILAEVNRSNRGRHDRSFMGWLADKVFLVF